jgi:hypothetical protein
MNKLLIALMLIGLVTLLCSLGFAANYIVTNDDNPSGNSATAFTVGANGTLTLLKQLKTGGTGLGGGFLGWTGVAISPNAKCVWVANTGSDTISAFEAPGFQEIGSYGIPGMFSANGDGGSIVVHPTGKLLVSGNSGTENISTWAVGSNCTLTHLADYTPSQGAGLYSPVGYTPNGAYLVVPSADFESAELFKQNTNGSLTDLGFISFSDSISECNSIGCFPTDMDFTSDSKLVLFSNSTTEEPSALTASITSTGLSDAQLWNLTSTGAFNVGVPRFTKNARAGNGILLFGALDLFGNTSGILCTNFTEDPLSITVRFTTKLANQSAQGSIVTFANEGWAAEPPRTIQSFSIASNCEISLEHTTVDPNSSDLLSIVAYPANQ